MKKVSTTILAFVLCTVCLANTITVSDFKIVKKQDGITLYERWITGSKNESVRELKAEFNVKSDVENVVNLLRDQQSGILWNKNASLYKIASTHHSNQWINYIKYGMPALFDDQECCLLYQMQPDLSFNENLCVIHFESTKSSLFPFKPDIKRITGIKGEWKLEQQSNGLKITYIISSDRSSNIPRFISDPIVHNNLFKTMENFKNLLENNHA